MGEVVYLQTRTEPWVSKRQLAGVLGRSIRWVEARQSDGMPSRLLAGRRQYRLSVVEGWLRDNGHLEDGE